MVDGHLSVRLYDIHHVLLLVVVVVVVVMLIRLSRVCRRVRKWEVTSLVLHSPQR